MQARVVGAPAAACSASAQAGLSRSRAMRQLTSSQAWCRSRSGALNTALASRQTSHPTPRSFGLADDVAVRGRGRARAARCITSSRSAVGTWITRAELFVEQRACSVSSSRRALDLRGPVLRVAVLGAAVGDAVAFGDQQVDVEAHADDGRRRPSRRPRPTGRRRCGRGRRAAGRAARSAVDRRRPATSAAPDRRGRAPRRRTGRAPAPASSRPCASGPGRGRSASASCRRRCSCGVERAAHVVERGEGA